MEPLNLTDETLDIHASARYHLSIQVSLNGFSFSVLNNVNNKYIALRYFPFQEELPEDIIFEKIEELLEKEELLQLEYKSVVCIYETRKITLVPSAFFAPENAKTFLSLNHYMDDLDELHYNEINELEAVSIFAIPNRVGNLLSDKFQGIKFFHHTTPVIKHGLKHYKHESEKGVVLLQIHATFIDILVISQGKLILQNTFLYRKEEDILFYLLSTIRQLKLDTEKLDLLISGTEKSDKLYNQIKEYIKKVNFQKPGKNYIFSYTFDKIQLHQYINLFTVFECV